ncbi:MAG TPA: hypothetical protein VFL57_04010 [Bryobacteraceae bacterium]|nr:hypothetical protein [Bryobacteraceae bacterium]
MSFKTLLFCLLLFDGTRALFRDSDAGWHIRTGEAILNGSGLPHSDAYSLLRAGQPWFAWEWAADLAMGALHAWGGLAAVAVAYAIVLAACTWVWFRLHWAVGGHFLLAGVMAVFMLSTVNMHWHARPHVVGWLMLMLGVWWAETAGSRMSASQALATGLFGALWANVHASFFLGTVIAVLYAAGHALRPLIWTADQRDEWARARAFAIAAAVFSLGTLLNPYGWRLHQHVISYLSNGELLSRVGEFQSFNFHTGGSAMVLATVACAAAGGVLALSQGRLPWFLISAVLLVAGLRSARGLPIVALVVLPIANGAITRALGCGAGLRPRFRHALDGFLNYGRNLRRLDRRYSGLALAAPIAAAALALSQLAAVQAYSGFPPEEFPVRAADRVAMLPARARILAPDKYGGYLIYRFNGTRRVYFDGRSDFYGARYMNDYLRIIEVRAGWRENVERFGFTHALLPNRYSLVPALTAAGWKTLYRDEVATLLEK